MTEVAQILEAPNKKTKVKYEPRYEDIMNSPSIPDTQKSFVRDLGIEKRIRKAREHEVLRFRKGFEEVLFDEELGINWGDVMAQLQDGGVIRSQQDGSYLKIRHGLGLGGGFAGLRKYIRAVYDELLQEIDL